MRDTRNGPKISGMKEHWAASKESCMGRTEKRGVDVNKEIPRRFSN